MADALAPESTIAMRVFPPILTGVVRVDPLRKWSASTFRFLAISSGPGSVFADLPSAFYFVEDWSS
jgi:hypothetical protein